MIGELHSFLKVYTDTNIYSLTVFFEDYCKQQHTVTCPFSEFQVDVMGMFFKGIYLSYICGALKEQVHTFYSSVEQKAVLHLLNLISGTQNKKIQNSMNNCFIHSLSKISLYCTIWNPTYYSYQNIYGSCTSYKCYCHTTWLHCFSVQERKSGS